MSALSLYFLVMLDDINSFCVFINIVGWAFIPCYLLFCLIMFDVSNGDEKYSKLSKKVLKITVPIMIV